MFIMSQKRPAVITAFLFSFFLVTLYIMRNDSGVEFLRISGQNSTNFENLSVRVPKEKYDKNIVLVIVVCPPPNNTGPRDEAVVLLKSLLISAKLNQIKNIEIYFFLENPERESEFIMGKLKQFGYPFDYVALILHFKDANKAVPKAYRQQFINGTDNKKLLRCTNVRIFFPSALPEVDSILYLDTDVVVHGDLSSLWSMFDRMDNEQLIGISTDYEEGSDRAEWFKNAPYPPPRGLNAGVLLLNLTRMRTFDWETKLLRLWKDYYKNVPKFNDQHLINIILYFNTDLLFRLPCHFNYMEQHCTLKSPCKSADTNGIQLIYGAAERFNWLGALRNYYLAYSMLNFTQLDLSSYEALRLDLQKSYGHYHDISKKHKDKKRQKLNAECHSILSKLI